MNAKILDGKVVRDKIGHDLKSKIETLRAENPQGLRPKLTIIQVGDLPESNAYIRQKILFGEKIGAIVQHKKLAEDFSRIDLEVLVANLNSDKSTHGIIVQLPIPDNLDKDQIINKIDPIKDVDGQTATNLKLLFEGLSSRHPRESEDQILKQAFGSETQARRVENDRKINLGYLPATTKGILTLLDYYKIPVAGKNVTVVGRSSLVGKPTALALVNLDATVTICHSRTKKLPEKTKNADILIVAAGKPNLIAENHVSPNQTVIDVGINLVNQKPTTRNQQPESELPNCKLIGDVKFDEVAKIVSAISPVPGGVGPMTVASLFQNLLEAYNRQIDIN
ncbi:MAG: Bifunctional protein FolD [Candidatus Curtissbacteria bacterium GW2011_GWA1_41_11]|uniref:Bifunctional protein FolD n=1 Tax=Candidatus Curtissbacteria bacterium GW2011_GWA1_41_11 TaxID=1618409 RepID=A0A0G0XJT4_9BACT|nr:MAG: Bifunctional protein FolD [Candidatus Curtissbacteria bacterium GW2011_GWA1_41_11]